MSAIRKQKRAATKAAEITERREMKEAAKGQVQTRALVPVKEPTERPYREPKPETKAKRAPRTVTERDGRKLLSKIHGKGGRDLIVMMRDSELAPQELARELMLNEGIVITVLGTFSTDKERTRHLLAAIEEAPAYLEKDGRAVTTGVRKQKRQDGAKSKREEIASRKRNPKTRELVTPTIEEIAPQREDSHIVLEELKRYLELNAELCGRFMGTASDLKAARILALGVGKRFDARVKGMLASPFEYESLLVEAGATIRGEMHKYDPPAASSTPTTSESPVTDVRHQSQQEKWENWKKTNPVEEKNQLDPGDPETEEKREIFTRQEESLRRLLDSQKQDS